MFVFVNYFLHITVVKKRRRKTEQMGNFNINTFMGANHFPGAMELWEYINQECFTLKDTGLSQRVINHWDKEGLLPDSSRVEGQWRRFSFADFIWIKFVEELRMVGLPLPVIKHVREGLFSPLTGKQIGELYKEHPEVWEHLPDNEFKPLIVDLLQTTDWENTKDEQITPFHMLIIDTITKKQLLTIIVYTDGSWVIWSDEIAKIMEEDELESLRVNTHVSVCMMKLIKDFIKNDPDLEEVPKFKLFAEHELKLLETVHSGKYDSLRIRFKDKKKKPVELKKSVGIQLQLVDVLMNNEYQDITVRSSKGELITIHNTSITKSPNEQ